MKRLAVTVFIALYTMVLMWSTVDRTYNWAAKQSEAIAHSTSDVASAVGKPRPAHPPHQANRRIIENQYLIAPPVLTSWISLAAQPLYESTDRWASGPAARHVSGRAPPALS